MRNLQLAPFSLFLFFIAYKIRFRLFILFFQIAHHHHHVPVPVHLPVHHHHPHTDYGPPVYDASGPGEYIHSRTDPPPGSFSSELASWGLGSDFPPGWDDPRITRSALPVTEPSKTVNYHHRPPVSFPGFFNITIFLLFPKNKNLFNYCLIFFK